MIKKHLLVYLWAPSSYSPIHPSSILSFIHFCFSIFSSNSLSSYPYIFPFILSSYLFLLMFVLPPIHPYISTSPFFILWPVWPPMDAYVYAFIHSANQPCSHSFTSLSSYSVFHPPLCLLTHFHLSFHLFFHLTTIPYLSICLSNYLVSHPSIYLLSVLSSLRISTYPSVHSPTHPLVSL